MNLSGQVIQRLACLSSLFRSLTALSALSMALKAFSPSLTTLAALSIALKAFSPAETTPAPGTADTSESAALA